MPVEPTLRKDEVARQICDRYTARLKALVRAELYSRQALSKQGGPTSLVQSALKSYFEWIEDKFNYEIDVERQWSLLARFAVRKCKKAYRSYKRKGGKERSLDSPLLPFADAIMADPNPSPEEVAIVSDFLEKFDEDDRRICDLMRKGYSQEEIAGEMGCSAKTVQRHLPGIRRRWQEMQEA